MKNHRTGPLTGCRIVEFDAIGPVPLAGMILSDLGADIVRIERPDRKGAERPGDTVLLRGRTRVELDLKNSQQREKALELVAASDGLIEGARPGVMERLGLGPDDCLARNPKLAYGRMTGWGQSGPLSHAAGHDINYIAITGALGAMGKEGEPPTPPLNLVGDYGGGTMFLCLGVISAILSARETGEGQVIDAAMTDGVSVLMSMFYAFEKSGFWKEERGANLIDGGAPYYRCYECADGKYIAVGALEPQFYSLLLEKLSLDASAYPQHDKARWPALADALTDKFSSKTRDEWAALFEGSDACVAPVLTMSEAPAHAQNAARQTFAERDGVQQPRPAPRFSQTPGRIGEAKFIGIDEAIDRWN